MERACFCQAALPAELRWCAWIQRAKQNYCSSDAVGTLLRCRLRPTAITWLLVQFFRTSTPGLLRPFPGNEGDSLSRRTQTRIWRFIGSPNALPIPGGVILSTDRHRDCNGIRSPGLPGSICRPEVREPVEHDRDLGSRRNGLLGRFPQEERPPVCADAEPGAPQRKNAE